MKFQREKMLLTLVENKSECNSIKRANVIQQILQAKEIEKEQNYSWLNRIFLFA